MEVEVFQMIEVLKVDARGGRGVGGRCKIELGE